MSLDRKARRGGKSVIRRELLTPKRTKAKICKHTGKHNWATRHDATLALFKARSKRLDGEKIEQRVYKCEHGEHWHLTSKEDRRVIGDA